MHLQMLNTKYKDYTRFNLQEKQNDAECKSELR